MTRRASIRVEPGQKVLIVGQNQSGKSTLATWIANAFRRALVLDPKLDDRIAELPNARIAWGAAAALRALPGRVIYRPTPRELGDLGGAFDPLCRAAYLSGAIAIVVHETEWVAPSSGAPHWQRTCLMAGASRAVTMIYCAQRPARIDRLVKSEAAHVIVTHLTDVEDRREIAGVMGIRAADLSPLPRHAFWHRGPDGLVRPMAPVTPRRRT